MDKKTFRDYYPGTSDDHIKTMHAIHQQIEKEDKANRTKKLIAVDHTCIDFRILQTNLVLNKVKGRRIGRAEREMAEMNGYRLSDFTH